MGLHIITGANKHVYIERQSYPVVSAAFISSIQSELIKDDDLFNAALVSLGAFGIIHGVMIETEPAYLLEAHRDRNTIDKKLFQFSKSGAYSIAEILPHPNERPFHLQLCFNFRAMRHAAVITTMYKRPFAAKQKLFRAKPGTAGPGEDVPAMFSKQKSSSLQLSLGQSPMIYDYFAPIKNAIGTSEEFFNNGVVQKGTIATALGFSAEHAWTVLSTLIELATKLGMAHTEIYTMRFIKKSQALLAFTKFENTCIMEIDAIDLDSHRDFFNEVWKTCRSFRFPITYHWGKLNDITPDNLKRSYGPNLDKWLAARKSLLPEESLKLFSSPQLREWGLT